MWRRRAILEKQLCMKVGEFLLWGVIPSHLKWAQRPSQQHRPLAKKKRANLRGESGAWSENSSTNPSGQMPRAKRREA